LGVVLVAGALGLALQQPWTGPATGTESGGLPATAEQERKAALDEIEARFKQAVVMLHANRHEYAVAALERVLTLAPRLPEAHANMGFALVGLGRFAGAEYYFQQALALRPEQLNAYFGLALCHENNGDLEAALGAMRVYVHLADEDDPYVRKAMSAIWEWEAAGDAARG
jgi:Flp pilus assembly protein TadD